MTRSIQFLYFTHILIVSLSLHIYDHARSDTISSATERGSNDCRIAMAIHGGRVATDAFDYRRFITRQRARKQGQRRELHTSSRHNAQAPSNHPSHRLCLLASVLHAAFHEGGSQSTRFSPLRVRSSNSSNFIRTKYTTASRVLKYIPPNIILPVGRQLRIIALTLVMLVG